jgi:hypothetical protein
MCVRAQKRKRRHGVRRCQLETNAAGAGGFEAETAASRRQLHGALKARRRKTERGIQFETICLVWAASPKAPGGRNAVREAKRRFCPTITGHPNYGLPFGQDRIVPIYLAALAMRQQDQTIRFRTAAEMLETFDMHKGGKEYRRLIDWSKLYFALKPRLRCGE